MSGTQVGTAQARPAVADRAGHLPDVEPGHGVPDLLELELPADATVVVVGDLHLRGAATAATRRVAEVVGARLDTVTGPAALVLNGDVIDLWAEPELTAERVLDAHPRLAAALTAFAERPGRHLVLVVGNHDARIAWDDVLAKALAARLGCRSALAVELVLATRAGPRRVRVEHGHGYDPVNAQRDPRNSLDSPLGQHIVQEVLPQLTATPLLADLGCLADGGDAARFAMSRTLYRQVGPRLWWLLLPAVASLALRAPVMVRALSHAGALGRVPLWLPLALAGVLVDVVGLAVVLGLLTRSLYSSVAVGSVRPGGAGGNGAPAAAAAALCRRGYAGLITGHTHAPQLSPVAGGFYANSGCALRCVQQRPARLGLPPVFVPILRISWVELHVEHDLRARLMLAEGATGENTRLERLAHRGRLPGPADVEQVAALPHAGYPLRSLDLDRRCRQERVRGWAALAVGGVGLISLGSAVTWPFQGRLRELLQLMPLDIPQTASATVAFVSVTLMLLGRGLRRGHRLAWGLAVGLLAGATVLHLLKGLDLEEASATALVGVWLARNRDAFGVREPARRWWLILPAAAIGVVGASIGLVLLFGQRSGFGLVDVLARLTGGERPLPGMPPILAPAVSAAGLALLLAGGLALTRKRLDREPSTAGRLADRERARRLVRRYGGDTLAYFALRDDKSWFFTGDCVVAYALRDGVCLVSPDPIGPAEQWAAAWAEFMAFADRRGWPLAVVGAGEGWLPVYAASGFRSMYMGDEAVVDCPAFSLEGRPMKQLRSACSRVRRAGYAVRFHDPATLPAELVEQMRAVLGQSRRGQVERGFSMTLSRVFDPADTGLLLSVAYRPDGRPAGFCQWAPAPDINGWSLDLMRRAADEDVPNGLIEFLIIETIRHVAAAGQWGLSLNFAVMRAVLAGEQGDGPLLELQAKVLNRFSDSMQIASLWRFNQKFGPIWRPRFIAVGRLSSAPAQTLAIVDAEGVAELPLIGRFIGRAHRRADGRVAAESDPA